MDDSIELDIHEGSTGDNPQPVQDPEKTTEKPAVFKNAELTAEYRTGAEPSESGFKLNIPPVPRDELSDQLRQAGKDPNVNLSTPEFSSWKASMEEAVSAYTPGSMYQDRFRDPQSLFAQGVKRGDGSLASISRPKFKVADGELKGEAAILQVSKSLGLGDTLTIPLPHSGIVVTIKPPNERALIDFYNTLFREKIYLGRASAGLTLTNMSAYLNNRLFNFMLEHVHSLNYKDIDKKDLGNYLLIHDYHILAWGFAATQYPNGFEYQRPCSSNVGKCTHIERGLINMLKLLWIDNTQLTDLQKQVLLDYRPNQLDVNQYNKYIADHGRVRPRTCTLSNGMIVHLKVPTFNEHISDGMGWVSRINEDIGRLITDEDSEARERSELLAQYVNASILRQFSHFVDYIEQSEAEGGGVIRHRETINKVLELLSSDDKIRPELTQLILKYKSDTTIGLIGIPSYNCPACKAEQNTTPVNESFVDVIPLDVMYNFFTLLTLRMSKILERE